VCVVLCVCVYANERERTSAAESGASITRNLAPRRGRTHCRAECAFRYDRGVSSKHIIHRAHITDTAFLLQHAQRLTSAALIAPCIHVVNKVRRHKPCWLFVFYLAEEARGAGRVDFDF
jgi:hypothetical protein